MDGTIGYVDGLAAGADNVLYFSLDRSVRKIDAKGRVSTIVDNVQVPGCIRIPGVEAQLGPYLRGLDVAPNGTIFVAAAGCGAVLRSRRKASSRPCCGRRRRTRRPP